MAVSRATIASRCTGCSENNGLNSLDNLLSLNTVITELMRPISIYGLDNLLSLMGSESARVRHFVHVAMFRIPPFHVRNARAINVSS